MERTDPQWLDRMYNNRALVPEHADHLARWAEDSRAARGALPCTLDIAYGPSAGQRLDVFGPRAAGAPVLVFIHGGYWRALDKSDHSFVAPPFVEAGACVVVPNYDLCPEVTIPQIVLQMVRAVAWVRRHIGAHGGDAQRITVAGHSAGGHLAAMLLACDWPAFDAALAPGVVRNALAISGLYDLEPLRQVPFLAPSLRLTQADALRASPARLPAPARGELACVVGADESAEFARHNLMLRAAWGVGRVPVCEALPGLNHFSVLQALVAPGHRLNALALEMLLKP